MPFEPVKRLRVFAGPNGSGKSTIYQILKSDIHSGIYINPDEIQNILQSGQPLRLTNYQLGNISTEQWKDFSKNHSIHKTATKQGLKLNVIYENGEFSIPKGEDIAYEPALISDFLIKELISHGLNLSFESVFSHPSKLETIKYAKQLGYRVYLYFICTKSAEINLARVNQRVLSGGHQVDPQKIEDRYFRALLLARETAIECYRSYFWDNSGDSPEFFAEIDPENQIQFTIDEIPWWFAKYIERKN